MSTASWWWGFSDLDERKRHSLKWKDGVGRPLNQRCQALCRIQRKAVGWRKKFGSHWHVDGFWDHGVDERPPSETEWTENLKNINLEKSKRELGSGRRFRGMEGQEEDQGCLIKSEEKPILSRKRLWSTLLKGQVGSYWIFICWSWRLDVFTDLARAMRAEARLK